MRATCWCVGSRAQFACEQWARNRSSRSGTATLRTLILAPLLQQQVRQHVDWPLFVACCACTRAPAKAARAGSLLVLLVPLAQAGAHKASRRLGWYCSRILALLLPRGRLIGALPGPTALPTLLLRRGWGLCMGWGLPLPRATKARGAHGAHWGCGLLAVPSGPLLR